MTTTVGALDGRLAAFYERDYGRLVASLAAKFRDDDLAHEAVDEAMSRAWIRLQAADDIECLGASVRTVATNVARDRLRRRATEARALETMLRPTTAEPAAVEMVDVDFERALDRLPVRQREIATLRYIHDLSCDEIAAELGTSSGYVRSALFRSRRAIVAALAVVAIIVATVMVRSDAQHDPVRVDITPATQPTPTTNALPQPSGGEDDAADPVVVGDAIADTVSPEPPRNMAGGWTITLAPGELVTLQVRNLTSLQVKDCWVEGCRLEFFPE